VLFELLLRHAWPYLWEGLVGEEVCQATFLIDPVAEGSRCDGHNADSPSSRADEGDTRARECRAVCPRPTRITSL
jgi:hypothetical protein